MAEKRDRTLHILGGLVVGFGLGWIVKNIVHPHIEEEEPEPGLIVISPPKTYTRGFEGYHDLQVQNKGEDSLTQVKLMLVDTRGIFDRFDIGYEYRVEYNAYQYKFYLYESVLNKFQTHHLIQTEDRNYSFPAGSTKTIKVGGISYGWHYYPGVIVKPTAPIGVHTLTWHIKYTTIPGLTALAEVRVPWKVTILETLGARRGDPVLLYPERYRI